MADSLARRPGDTAKSWQALQDYAAMGAGRSLEKLCDWYRSGTESVPTKRLTSLKDWSRTGDWAARVAAYDESLAAAERATREALLAEKRAAWVARHMEADEVLALLADQARGSIEDIQTIERVKRRDLLPVPAPTEENPDAVRWERGPEYEDIERRWDWEKAQRTGAIHLIKKIRETKYGLAVELYDAHEARVKIGEHHGLFKQASDILKYLDLSKLSPAQLQRLANGDDPLAVLLDNQPPTESAGGA